MLRQVSRRTAVFLVLLGIAPFVSDTPLAAQSHSRCTGPYAGTFQVTPGLAHGNLPPQTVKLVLVGQNGSVVDDKLSAVQNGKWTPAQADIDKLTPAQPAKARLLFLQVGVNTGCEREFNVTPPPGTQSAPGKSSSVGTGTAAETVFTQADCSKAGAAWDAELTRRPGRRVSGFTELVFLESQSGGDANICYYNRDYGVVGDPIYVGVFGRKQVTWETTRFEPCAAQAVAPNVQQSSERFPSTLQAGDWQLQTFLERRCYNTAVDVSIVGKKASGENVVQRYALTQYDRYRGTVQAGILYTD